MKTKFLIIAIFFPLILSGQKFNGIETNLGNLFRLSDSKSRSISTENFSGMGWGKYSPINSLAVTVNPGSAFNCYWPMPFRKKCKVTMENISDNDMILYYQIDYLITEVPADAGYFHAQFRRVSHLPYKENYVLVDKIKGKGQYVGTYLAWEVHDNGWWGEGEIKFYMDG